MTDCGGWFGVTPSICARYRFVGYHLAVVDHDRAPIDSALEGGVGAVPPAVKRVAILPHGSSSQKARGYLFEHSPSTMLA